ncbi:RHS repeat-associated core domain-containing protein [Roseateles sp. SL47]|uniref:RHS repeat domain-containing protein n=1 Tax=Roseateles sp. SL47 TaxID=2995138 RepID=UPI0022702F41|nr:RHS repeat-associated core domain-containing protein [Roseateles sp. SL47]WAC74698.1 RHS repeat-associated core domain-containing protein [Roseateles sp. SL47]
MSYDDSGRLATQTYPTGLQVVYRYSDLGFVQSLNLGTAVVITPQADASGVVAPGATLAAGAVLWSAKTYNARGQAQQSGYGNGVVSQSGFDGWTGRPTTLAAGLSGGTEVLSQSYGWDNLGRLRTRTDANGAGGGTGAVTDDLIYDELGRLKSYTVSAPQMPNLTRTVELRYNAGGQLLYKSDVGIYSYGVAGHAHALAAMASTTAGIESASYGYDASGNLVSATAGKYRALTYTSFNLPAGQGANGTGALQGAPGGAAYGWYYDENHQRLKEVRSDASGTRTTWMLHPDAAGGLSFETETMVGAGATTTRNRHYLSAGGSSIGVIITADVLPTLVAGQTAPVVLSTVTAVRVEYWHKDSLGSLMATTDHRGVVTARYSYDPFGKRRQANGTYDAAGVLVVDWVAAANYGTDRGFTGHEHLDDVGLIHMNGRIYDPTVGVFLQADPMIQSADDLQNYNRYGYCFNNPMTCTDPTGYSFLSKWVGSTLIGGVLDFFAPGLGTLLSSLYQVRMIARTKLGYQLGSIAIGVMSAVYCKGAVAQCNALGQAGWAALAGHSASDVIRTGVMAYVSASVNKQIGDTFKLGSMTFYNTVAHGVWGCAEAKLNGGACSSGFRGGLAGAALSNYADLEYNKGSEGVNIAVNTAIHAVTGGLASLAGGGSFAEGVRSAAYAYLFNHLLHIYGLRREGSSNIFGHSATAISGSGVFSFGNDTPLGASVTEYVRGQSEVRDQIIVYIPTTAEQDQSAREYVSQFSDSKLPPGKFESIVMDNCAVHSVNVMNSAGVLGTDQYNLIAQAGVPILPSTASMAAGSIPNAVVIRLPQGAAMSPALQKLLSGFDKK